MPHTNVVELSGTAVARFARDLTALGVAPDARLLVAVSGGPDSIALLLLAHAALGDRCRAATVDHGLRDESGAEAAWVAELCADRGIGHAVLSDQLPPRAGRTANVSARARALRYRLLQAEADRNGADHIATAHHADDQVETLVMRLNRGAGVAGLAGVRSVGGRVVRPLLGWRKSELAALVAAQGIVAVDDPSNTSDRFDRARLRRALAGIDWLDADRWTVSATAIGDAEDALGWMMRRLEQERCVYGRDGSTLQPDGVPFELQRRLVEQCVVRIDPDAGLRGSAVAEAVRRLAAGERTMLGAVLGTPRNVGEAGAVWHFALAPPRR